MGPSLPHATVDGFELQVYAAYDNVGDAAVRAPDGSTAGLILQAGSDPALREVHRPDDRRWGVFKVGLPMPMATDAEAAAYLHDLLPELRPRWQAWSATDGTRR